VVAAVADGKTDKEIAAALGLQPKTVRNYLGRAFEKLGVNSRTQAAVLFDRHRRA
jgi:DNA-binding NarL/FixJ family response regulator